MGADLVKLAIGEFEALEDSSECVCEREIESESEIEIENESVCERESV